MPYSPKEVRYLLSKASPLTPAQRQKMLAELHANPSLGKQKKGSKAMKRG